MFRRELEKAELEIKKTTAIIAEYKQVPFVLPLGLTWENPSSLTHLPLCVSDLLPAEHQAGKTAGGDKRGAGHRQGEITPLMPNQASQVDVALEDKA